MAVKKYVWIGHRIKTGFCQYKYELGKKKKDWDPEKGFKCSPDGAAYSDDSSYLQGMENYLFEYLGIKLQPGEVAKLELNIVRTKKGGL